MDMIDILAKLREYEKAGHSVADAVKSAEMTQPELKKEGGMSDIHIGAQEIIGDYVDDDGNLKMPKAQVMKAMADQKEKASFPQSYEIETAMKMVADKFDDAGKAVDESEEVTAEEKAKPDYIDLDGDGNKTEPMKKAAQDAKKESAEITNILKLAGI